MNGCEFTQVLNAITWPAAVVLSALILGAAWIIGRVAA